MFKIKICGITTHDDAIKSAEFGADAIGLNFYEKSLRSVTIERARKVVDRLPDPVSRIGVFVNATVDEIVRTVDEVGLDFVQLHGDENPPLFRELGSPVIRAVRLPVANGNSKNFQQAAVSQVSPWIDSGVSAILLDAASASGFGGTGKKLDWSAISKLEFSVPLILAGGLNAENVARAIQQAKPDAVDVASGVESFPGKKDASQMKSFIESARNEFRQ